MRPWRSTVITDHGPDNVVSEAPESEAEHLLKSNVLIEGEKGRWARCYLCKLRGYDLRCNTTWALCNLVLHLNFFPAYHHHEHFWTMFAKQFGLLLQRKSRCQKRQKVERTVEMKQVRIPRASASKNAELISDFVWMRLLREVFAQSSDGGSHCDQMSLLLSIW